jgi:hypothetical protein
MAPQDPDLGPDGGPADAPLASMRQSTTTDSKTAIADGRPFGVPATAPQDAASMRGVVREFEMTRLNEPPERARTMARQDTDLRPDGGPAADAPASKRQSTITDTRTAIAQPRAPRRAAALRCPDCEKVQDGPLRGPWMKRFFGLMGIPPYRCRVCRRRFSGFEGETYEPAMNQLDGGVFSTFLRPADNRSFDDVIREMARDERVGVQTRLDR